MQEEPQNGKGPSLHGNTEEARRGEKMDLQTVQNRISGTAAAITALQIAIDDGIENGGGPSARVTSAALELYADLLEEAAAALEEIQHERRNKG